MNLIFIKKYDIIFIESEGFIKWINQYSRKHLSFRNKASVVRAKKGKGSFVRKPKYKNQMFDKI